MSEARDRYNKVLDKLNQQDSDDVFIYVTELEQQNKQVLEVLKEIIDEEYRLFCSDSMDRDTILEYKLKSIIESVTGKKIEEEGK